APGDVPLLPGNVQHFGDDAMHVDDRVGPEVADPRLDGQPAVRLDHEEPVEPDSPPEVAAHRDADPADLRATPTVGDGLALVPLEELGATIDGFFQERPGNVGALSLGVRRAHLGLSGG